MLIYFIIWLFLCICSFIDHSTLSLKNKQATTLCLSTIMVLFCGFRGDIDRDYSNYVGYWEHAPFLLEGGFVNYITSIFIHPIEPGFIFSCSFFKSLGLSHQSIFIFCSFLTFFIFYKCIRNLTKYTNSSLFIFVSQFIMMPFMQIRFGVAMVAIFYALICWWKGHYKKMILYIIFAFCFHRLALGCLLFIPFIKLSTKSLIILAAVGFLIPQSFIFDTFMSFLNTFGWGHYEVYLQGDSGGGGLISLILYVILLYPFLFFWKGKFAQNTNNELLLKMYVLSILIFFYAIKLPILMRISNTYSISICFILPLYFTFMKKTYINYIIPYFIMITYCLLKYIPNLKFFEPYYINL